jgi:hypothetical protein
MIGESYPLVTPTTGRKHAIHPDNAAESIVLTIKPNSASPEASTAQENYWR